MLSVRIGVSRQRAGKFGLVGWPSGSRFFCLRVRWVEFVVGLNRPGFDGGGDDRKDHCHGLKEILVGAAGAGHEDER